MPEVYIAVGPNDQGRAALQHALRQTAEYADSEVGEASVAAMWGKLGDYSLALAFCSRVVVQDGVLFSGLYARREYSAALQIIDDRDDVNVRLAALDATGSNDVSK